MVLWSSFVIGLPLASRRLLRLYSRASPDQDSPRRHRPLHRLSFLMYRYHVAGLRSIDCAQCIVVRGRWGQ